MDELNWKQQRWLDDRMSERFDEGERVLPWVWVDPGRRLVGCLVELEPNKYAVHYAFAPEPKQQQEAAE